MTAADAAERIARFKDGLPAAVTAGLNEGLKGALRTSVTKYMQGLGTGANAQPPNPPPGPLGIRTGDLRRSVAIVQAKPVGAMTFQGGLTVGIIYGPTHEYGRDRIPARPYMHPALLDERENIKAAIGLAVARLAVSVGVA